MMRKMLLIGLMLGFLTGCNDYHELNKIALVIAMGIDTTKNKDYPYQVTLQIVNPSEVAGGGGMATTGKALPVMNLRAKGKSIVDAIRQISTSSSRWLFFGHTSLLVLQENVAKHDVFKVVDQLSRSPQASVDTPVFIARKISAEELLNNVSALEKIPALSDLHKAKYTQMILGETFPVSVQELIEDSTTYGREATLPGILLDKKGGTQEDTLQINPPKTKISGVALFRNRKLTGWLDGEESLVASLTRGKATATNMNVDCGKDYFSLTLIQLKPKMQVEVKNEKAVITLHAKGQAAVAETTCPDLDFQKPKDIQRAEKLANKALEQQLKRGIKKAQQYESDVFGFGETFHNKHPKQWKKMKEHWPTIFGKAEVKVHVKLSVARTNMRSEPIKPVFPKEAS